MSVPRYGFTCVPCEGTGWVEAGICPRCLGWGDPVYTSAEITAAVALTYANNFRFARREYDPYCAQFEGAK